MEEVYVVGYDPREQDKVFCPRSEYDGWDDDGVIGVEEDGHYYCNSCELEVDLEHFNTHINPGWLIGKVVVLPEGSHVFDAWKEIPDMSQDPVTLITEFEQKGGCTRACPKCGEEHYVEIDADFNCKCGYHFVPII